MWNGKYRSCSEMTLTWVLGMLTVILFVSCQEEASPPPLFAAQFDSLFAANALPEIEKAGLFTTHEVDETRSHLTLKMGSSAWDRLSYIQKKNLVVHMLVTFGTARMDAAFTAVRMGGLAVDPTDCDVSIEDMWNEKYAEASFERSAREGSMQPEDIKIYK